MKTSRQPPGRLLAFTPGPWKVCRGSVVQAYSPYDTIAQTYDDRTSTEDSPNGTLIAAAPELAASVRELLGLLVSLNLANGPIVKESAAPDYPQVIAARAALDKAGI
jgi:hypothetical protein